MVEEVPPCLESLYPDTDPMSLLTPGYTLVGLDQLGEHPRLYLG